MGQVTAARSLYNKRLYPEATFMLQQSVENALKAYGLLVIDNFNSRATGHVALKVLYEYMPILVNAMAQNYGLLQDVLTQIKQQQTWPASKIAEGIDSNKILSTTGQWNKQMQSMSTQYTQMLDPIISIVTPRGRDNKAARKLWMEILELQGAAGRHYKNLRNDSKKADKKAKAFIFKLGFATFGIRLLQNKNDARKIYNGLKYVLHIYYSVYTRAFALAYLTSLHQEPTRYPPDIDDYWDMDAYKKTVPFVKNLPSLITETQSMVKALKSAVLAVNEYNG